MKNVTNALAWAAAILTTAFVMNANGMNDGTTFAVVIGLSTAALATFKHEKNCASI